MINRIPEPGSRALQARTICAELSDKVSVIAPDGIGDFDAADAAGAEFLIQLVTWEISADPATRWVWVLGALQTVVSAAREAALECPVEDDEAWKLT